MFNLELRVEDAKSRILSVYERTKGKCFISFSGGKDSTIVAMLYLMLKKEGRVGEIPLVFSDTKVEFDAIYSYIDWFSKNIQEVTYLQIEKPFAKILKEDGKPALSKLKSACLATYQKQLAEGNPDVFKVARVRNMVEGSYGYRVPNKYFHFLHEDFDIRISSKCCDYLKKKPFHKYEIEQGMEGFITGIRSSEGGIRKQQAKTCTTMSRVTRSKSIIHSMPIHDWEDDIVEEFIKEYKVPLSRAYTEYGLRRTGCVGCPYSTDLGTQLEVLHKHEPNKYKACMRLLGDVYIQQEVQLPFDEEYMARYEEAKMLIAERRHQMLWKHRPRVAHKWRVVKF